MTDADRGATGTVSDEALERWVVDARSAYLDRCATLRGAEAAGRVLRFRAGTRSGGAALGRPDTVVVSAGVTEVRPSSFTISVRLRPLGDDAAAVVDTSCTVRLVDGVDGEPAELGVEIRDELIGLERAAEHYN